MNWGPNGGGQIHRKGVTSFVNVKRAAVRLLVLGLVIAFGIAPTTSGKAQGVTVATFGDWSLQCDVPPGALYEQCALRQWVAADDRNNIGLYVFVLKTADHQAQLIRIVVPLGVLLPMRLSLSIDGGAVRYVEYSRCLQEGCFAETVLEEELLERLRTGSTAVLTVFVVPDQGIEIPISLLGFNEGFEALP